MQSADEDAVRTRSQRAKSARRTDTDDRRKPRTAKSEPGASVRAHKRPTHPASLYPYMDKAGFPQAWHAKRQAGPAGGASTGARAPETRGEAATSKPSTAGEAQPRTTGRGAAGDVAGSAARRPRKPRPDADPQSTAPARSSDSESAQADVKPSTRTRHAAAGHPDLAPPREHAGSGRSPYAFKDTVGFPEPYRPAHTAAPAKHAPANSGAKAKPKSTGRTTRSRSDLPPGYVQVD